MALSGSNSQRACIDVSLPTDGSRGMLALVLGLHCFLAAAAVASMGMLLCWFGICDQVGDILDGGICFSHAVASGSVGSIRNDLRCMLVLSLGGMLTFFLQCRHSETASRSTTMRALTENVYAIASLL